jgi:hypothetical protein
MSDRDVITELRNATGGDKETVVFHYVYFPTMRAAEIAAMSLESDGFSVESRLGADGVNWLVLARHRIVPDEVQIERHRAMFEALARRGNGEYDGWEAEVK